PPFFLQRPADARASAREQDVVGLHLGILYQGRTTSRVRNPYSPLIGTIPPRYGTTAWSRITFAPRTSVIGMSLKSAYVDQAGLIAGWFIPIRKSGFSAQKVQLGMKPSGTASGNAEVSAVKDSTFCASSTPGTSGPALNCPAMIARRFFAADRICTKR